MCRVQRNEFGHARSGITLLVISKGTTSLANSSGVIGLFCDGVGGDGVGVRAVVMVVVTIAAVEVSNSL